MLAATLVCMTWKITRKKVLGTIGIVLGVSSLLAVSWNSLAERFGESSWQDETDTEKFENRGQYFGLAKAILKDRFFGVGLNNWSYHVSKTYGERTGSPYEDYDDIPPSVLYGEEIYDWAAKYAPPAHNLGVITVGEMGVPGLIIFLMLWLRWFSMGARFLWRRVSDPMYRIGTGIFFCICGIFLQSLTEWVYRQTAILLTFHVLLGTLASLYYIRKHRGVAPEDQSRAWDEAVDAEIIPEPATAGGVV
jgi:O-antigen ligase